MTTGWSPESIKSIDEASGSSSGVAEPETKRGKTFENQVFSMSAVAKDILSDFADVVLPAIPTVTTKDTVAAVHFTMCSGPQSLISEDEIDLMEATLAATEMEPEILDIDAARAAEKAEDKEVVFRAKRAAAEAKASVAAQRVMVAKKMSQSSKSSVDTDRTIRYDEVVDNERTKPSQPAAMSTVPGSSNDHGRPEPSQPAAMSTVPGSSHDHVQLVTNKPTLPLDTRPPQPAGPGQGSPPPTWPAGLVEEAVKAINSHNAGDARGRDEEKQERRDKEEQARLRRALWAAEETARYSEVQLESLRGAHHASEMQSNMELQRVYELGAHRGQSEAQETAMRERSVLEARVRNYEIQMESEAAAHEAATLTMAREELKRCEGLVLREAESKLSTMNVVAGETHAADIRMLIEARARFEAQERSLSEQSRLLSEKVVEAQQIAVCTNMQAEIDAAKSSDFSK